MEIAGWCLLMKGKDQCPCDHLRLNFLFPIANY